MQLISVLITMKKRRHLMSVIKCPHCGEVFTIDETNYNSIVKQIRDHEFQEEIAQREKLLKKQMETSLQLAENKAKSDLEKQRSEQESELSRLKHQNELLKSEYDAKIAQALAEQNAEYEKNLSAANQNSAKLENELNLLKEQMEAKLKLAENNAQSDLEKQRSEQESELSKLRHQNELLKSEYDAKIAQALAEQNAAYEKNLSAANRNVSGLENEIRLLKEKIAHAESDKASAVKETAAVKEKEAADLIAKYTNEITELRGSLSSAEQAAKAKLETKEAEKRLAVEQAVAKLKEENSRTVTNYMVQIDTLKNDAKIREESMKESYENLLAAKETEIENQKELVERYKDFKVRQSTKMIGESLEQHCSYEFNRYRASMFRNAYFEKDNDARTGSKGDFIFREMDEDGKTEILSIMFEMKNEADATATKHRNEDFFRELDKDRREKGCEYAILVSMLELDNDLYNEGIVDVSYQYEKMYVVRPQFFVPIITILRNAALNTVSYKKQLLIERNNNLDIAHFEENMMDFKTRFGKNYELASRKFKEAIEDIDKTIKDLEKTKAALLSSENNLRLANDKAQDLSIKKLTKNAPSLREKFAEAKKESEDQE